jgi:hypothetical protein
MYLYFIYICMYLYYIYIYVYVYIYYIYVYATGAEEYIGWRGPIYIHESQMTFVYTFSSLSFDTAPGNSSLFYNVLIVPCILILLGVS